MKLKIGTESGEKRVKMANIVPETEATSKEVKVVLLTTLMWAITALTFVFVSISGFVLGLGAYQSGVVNTALAVIVSTPVWAPFGFFLTKGYNLAHAAREEAKKPSPRFELARKKLTDL